VAGRLSLFIIGSATLNWFIVPPSYVIEMAELLSLYHLVISVCPKSLDGTRKLKRKMWADNLTN
jgi:hypothetical protein